MKPETITFEVVDPGNITPGDGKPAHYLVVLEPRNPITKCTIKLQYEPIIESVWMIIAAGIGVCKHGDTYDKETGCRMALQSALRMVKNDHRRKLIWEKYLELFPVKDRKQSRGETEIVFSCTLEELANAVNRHRMEAMRRKIMSAVPPYHPAALFGDYIPTKNGK